MLESYDSKLQCAQCHVEYNCNPGIDPKTGAAIGMADQRTNIFPLVDVNNITKFYDSINFRDFRHFQTGALLTKMQHPDAEVFWNSKHDKAGVQCAVVPHAEGDRCQDQEDLHVALADEPEALHQADLPAPATPTGTRSRRST